MQKYNLTTPQQNIYNETKFYSDTALGNIGGTLEFSMEGLTSEIIEKAINLLIDAAEGLRLRITEEGGEVCQYVSEHKYESISVIDARKMTDEQIDDHVNALMRKPITYDGKLYRFEILKKADSWLIVAVMHHIVSDAWSMTIIDDAILHACEALIKGEEPVLNIAPYTDVVAKEQEYFSSKKYQKDKAFWSEMYAEHPEYVRLKPNAMTSTSPSANRLYAEVSPALSAQIKAFCAKYEYSPATVFEAAMLIYLNRINGGGKTPSLGLAVLNRDGAKDKRTLGMFISTIPLTAKPSEDKTLGELCAEINDLHLQIFRHQKYPYSHILSDIHQHYGDVEKLFDVMMSYQNAQIDAESNVRSKWYTNGNSEVALAFHIDDRDHLGVYKLNLDYQTEQFPDEAEVALLKDRILCIVEQITAKSDMTVADVDILPESEKELIIHTFNDTAMDYPSDKCVHQLFEEVVANIPNEIAAVFEGASYTYAEINRMANCIAHVLRRGGIGRNDIVPIIAHRSHLVLAAQLGVLKAGGAYLPIDPTFPAERITYMLDDASCKAALILDADAPTNVDFVIDLADEALYANAPDNLGNINEPNDLCYVIYTSGSTGKPKGTMLMHGNVVNFCSNNEHNIITHCITEEQKRIVSTTTIGFDIYVTESLLSLLNGLTVYYANDDESKMQSKLAKLVVENEIEIIQTTPTKMKMYMQDKSDLAWLSRLKVIILGGEVFPESLYEELRHYTDARIWNIYGPTETTVWSSVDEVTSPVITIGNPIANTQILICNEKGALCPVGIAGELCIAGDGVCRGYLNREELTAEKFIDNPYVPGKLYKTGDLASYRTDGKLLCYGRIDSQVKIRGLRVELGEIESVMNSFDGIVLSATTVKTSGEHQYLVGYYVAESDIDEKKLREHILAQLPKYMCPHYFMRLEKIAFTPNGKIDRKNLPDVDFENRENHNEITLPETPMQQEVYEVLCDFIKGTAFGIDEDFFDLGMDSLTAINLTSALSKKYACELSVNDVYKFNTVEKMAEHLSQFASHTKNHDLVLIKDGGDTNLFLIHGGNGVVGNFVQLSTQIETNYNWYGVDYPMNEEFYYPHVISIPELAAQYVERISAVQPHGPYHLCGYCIGGQIVLEMAYLLEQAGEKVEALYFIAAASNEMTTQVSFNPTEDDINISNALFGTTEHNRSLLNDDKGGIWNTIYHHIDDFEIDLDEIRNKLLLIMKPVDLTRAIPDFYNADLKTILYYVNMIRSFNYGGSETLAAHVVSAPIYLFTGNRDTLLSNFDINADCWQKHTFAKLLHFYFDGDHFSWFEEGRNAEFLSLFEKSLKETLVDAEALTLLKAGNDKNIFFIHGGNGLATAFVSLCNKVNIDATCWGVGLPFNKENYQPQLRTIHEMAKWYIERIRKVQPRGPYSFGGYCIGAVIGLEMAYILEQEGETVEVLYGVSTLANDIACQGEGIDLAKEKDFVINLFADTVKNLSVLVQATSDNIWDTVYAHIAELEIDPIAFRERAFQIMQPVDIKRGIPNFDTCEIKDILYYINVIRSLCHVSTTLTEHRVINAPIYLFSADKDTMVSDIELNAKCWQSHTTADFENIIYDGDHFNMYEPENNDDFCEKFSKCYTAHRIENLTLLKQGDDTNIFFIHGGNGEVAEFIGLCNSINFSSTCWGIHLPHNDENYYPKILDIPTLAQKYVKRIQAVQPHGTYTLCGYCVGGQLALEIAYLLEQSGETVEKIYNIATLANDLASVNAAEQTIEKVHADDRAIVTALFDTTPNNHALLQQIDGDNIWRFVYENLDNFEINIDVFRETIKVAMLPVDMTRAVPDFYHSDVRKILYYSCTIRSLIYGSGRYTEKRVIHAPIYLFSPDKDDMVADIPLNARLWQSHTTEPITNIVYNGDHFSWYEDGKNAEFLKAFEEVVTKGI